jgi:putative intracellular protease/amidase
MIPTLFIQRLVFVALSVSFLMPAEAAAPEPGRSASALPLVHVQRHPGDLPVVVVVAQKEAVLSDFVVPYGVLAQSGAAKVIGVNVAEGPLKAGPLTLVPDMTAAEFDRTYPDGADYVIVPATADNHAEEIAWLRAQRARGAAMVSICDGVELLAEAGALDGRRATGHWASLPGRRKDFPKVTWVTNVRYVADGDVASSAGVSASLPTSLALIETIAGPQVARETAGRLGVESWDVVHDSDVFKVGPADIAVHTANMHLKRDEVVALMVDEGDDEVALSLHAEAWSRTMRDKVRLVSERGGPLRMHGGLLVQTQPAASIKPDVRIVLHETTPAGSALTADLDLIAHRYSTGTARLAALGIEYPWGDLQATH